MKKLVLSFVAVAVCALSSGAARGGDIVYDLKHVREQLEKYAPVKIEVDAKLLDAKQKKLVAELVEASRPMNDIYLRQVYEKNPQLMKAVELLSKANPELYEYYKLNYGPWDRLDHDKRFMEDAPKKPAGAAFYPVNMTKEEFEAWLSKNPSDKEAFESNFTVIRRDGKSLVAVPYSEAYRPFLEQSALHLRRAAKLTDNASLKKFLLSRANAFFSNDYFESDVDWVGLKDHDIEFVIGPYEVYEDNLFGYKAAFEAYLTRVDPVESERLSKVVGYLSDLEGHLPIDDKYKGRGRSLESPIVVANEIYGAGEGRRGVQTLAFNLPNDERVRKDFGSKKVMLKNVQQAKFEKILLPIASSMMRPEDVTNVDFEAFFAQTLLHEISHGIGPGEITVNGIDTTVNRELKDVYSVIEECKADVLGVYNNIYLIGKGLYPSDFAAKIWPTYLAGLFRSMRFGINEAHGGGNAIQFNYLLDKGAFTYDAKSGLFGVNNEKIEKTIEELAREVLMIEAKGDYKAAKQFVAKYQKLRPELEKAFTRLDKVPVDIRPIYAFE